MKDLLNCGGWGMCLLIFIYLQKKAMTNLEWRDVDFLLQINEICEIFTIMYITSVIRKILNCVKSTRSALKSITNT